MSQCKGIMGTHSSVRHFIQCSDQFDGSVRNNSIRPTKKVTASVSELEFKCFQIIFAGLMNRVLVFDSCFPAHYLLRVCVCTTSRPIYCSETAF